MTDNKECDTIKSEKVIHVIEENSKLKDRLFDKIYESEESRKHLAEFVIGKTPDETVISNVRPVIFGNKYNDLAFLYDRCMYIMLEEQSTECANIAYRMLEYVVAGLRQQIDTEQILYSNTLVRFPVPKLFAVNVGLIERKAPVKQVEYDILLSNAFLKLKQELLSKKPDLELTVHMYDFRMTKEEVLMYVDNNQLPDRLAVYSLKENELLQYGISAATITYLQRAMRHQNYQMPVQITSVELMIEELKNRGVLRELFQRKEVCDMTRAQFSRDDILRYSGIEEGRIEGRLEGRLEGQLEAKKEIVIKLVKSGMSEQTVSQIANIDIDLVHSWIEEAEEN